MVYIQRRWGVVAGETRWLAPREVRGRGLGPLHPPLPATDARVWRRPVASVGVARRGGGGGAGRGEKGGVCGGDHPDGGQRGVEYLAAAIRRFRQFTLEMLTTEPSP